MTFRAAVRRVLHPFSREPAPDGAARDDAVGAARRAEQQELRRAALQDEVRLRQSTQGQFGPGGMSS